MPKRTVKNDYILSRNTLAIITRDHQDCRSLILEQYYQEMKSLDAPVTILNRTCILYGADFEGRRKYAQHILKTDKKIPVSIIPQHGVFMFPTAATTNRNCVWLSYYRISNYQMHNDFQTLVTFDEGSLLIVDIPAKSFQRQYNLTGQLVAQSLKGIVLPDFGTCPFLTVQNNHFYNSAVIDQIDERKERILKLQP
ncbi:competence protein ComK [Aquibacillus sp. 3ASR75-11]|uniref:Competence protein ComK n=1 Tax=Terrihalobacillus insolitus TaxID=2950438 RepID=A0A9X4AM77_9BACI|nr:competence protein ComK [Terrihalobacillus insolitus]MDC3425006.1 competence protein ComK [Terrihalobacillus insolitus]